MKKIFNKGPVTNTNCNCNESTAENDYLSMLEMFINKLYADENFELFGLTKAQAEEHVCKEMELLGYNTEMVNRAFGYTVNNFKSKYTSVLFRLDSFVKCMLKQPHKDYHKQEYPFEFRFVLTLILGYLGKLDSTAIINCDNPETYFENKVADVCVPDLAEAIDKVRIYSDKSNALVLAEGMRKFDAWLERLHIKIIPPKELTIADIEKQLGYKIKIVGDDK